MALVTLTKRRSKPKWCGLPRIDWSRVLAAYMRIGSKSIYPRNSAIHAQFSLLPSLARLALPSCRHAIVLGSLLAAVDCRHTVLIGDLFCSPTLRQHPRLCNAPTRLLIGLLLYNLILFLTGMLLPYGLATHAFVLLLAAFLLWLRAFRADIRPRIYSFCLGSQLSQSGAGTSCVQSRSKQTRPSSVYGWIFSIILARSLRLQPRAG